MWVVFLEDRTQRGSEGSKGLWCRNADRGAAETSTHTVPFREAENGAYKRNFPVFHTRGLKIVYSKPKDTSVWYNNITRLG